MHRDLKPENIMLETADDLDVVKLIDFGQATLFDPAVKLTKKLGTPYYVAPEVLQESYNYKCDIWSVGKSSQICLRILCSIDACRCNCIRSSLRLPSIRR